MEDRRIGVKFGYIMTEIIFPRVSQEIEFRLVRPQDCAVSCNPVQTEGGGLDEIAKGRLTVA